MAQAPVRLVDQRKAVSIVSDLGLNNSPSHHAAECNLVSILSRNYLNRDRSLGVRLHLLLRQQFKLSTHTSPKVDHAKASQ